jgi:hypothetical protein
MATGRTPHACSRSRPCTGFIGLSLNVRRSAVASQHSPASAPGRWQFADDPRHSNTAQPNQSEDGRDVLRWLKPFSVCDAEADDCGPRNCADYLVPHVAIVAEAVGGYNSAAAQPRTQELRSPGNGVALLGSSPRRGDANVPPRFGG